MAMKELALSTDAGGDQGRVGDARRGGHAHEGTLRDGLRAVNRLHCALAQVLRTPLRFHAEGHRVQSRRRLLGGLPHHE